MSTYRLSSPSCTSTWSVRAVTTVLLSTSVELFWSLLGALAYALITQHWLAVYVVALQRQSKAPKVIHVRRLNALVRVAQKRPARILYRAMECCRILECHADSGFTKEQDSGYGIRGANFMRAGRERGVQGVKCGISWTASAAATSSSRATVSAARRLQSLRQPTI